MLNARAVFYHEVEEGKLLIIEIRSWYLEYKPRDTGESLQVEVRKSKKGPS